MTTRAKVHTSAEIFGSFFLGASEFALCVENVQEVIHSPGSFTQVPLAPNYFLGLFNLRGSVLPAIDLRVLLDLPPSAQEGVGKLAIVDCQGYSVGLLFDQTSEIFRAQAEELTRFDYKAPNDRGVVDGVIKREGGKRVIQLLSVNSLLDLPGVSLPGKVEGGRRRDVLQQQGQRKQCIAFTLGPARTAFNIESIQEILKVDRLDRSPLAVHSCIGTLALRGRTLPVFDLAAHLGYRRAVSASEAGGDRRVIVTRIGGDLFGMLVDSVANLVSYFADEVLPFPAFGNARQELFLGCLSNEKRGGDIVLLAPDKIFSESEIVDITRGHSGLYRETAAKTGSKETSAVRRTYVTFHLENTFALPIEELSEIIQFPADSLLLPSDSGRFRGMLNLRGELIPIADARQIYGLQAAPDYRLGKVLILRGDNLSFGLMVDTADAIVRFSASEVIPLPQIFANSLQSAIAEDVQQAVEIEAGGANRTVFVLSAQAIRRRVRG